MTTVIISQGMGPSPYALQREPFPWAEFLGMVRSGEYPRARIVEGDERAPWGHVAYQEDAHGFVVIANANVDSSD